MTFDNDNGHVTLSSGRRFYAYSGMLSIAVDGDDDWIGYGHDGVFQERIDEEPFSADERKEIAEHMIARWKKWGGI